MTISGRVVVRATASSTGAGLLVRSGCDVVLRGATGSETIDGAGRHRALRAVGDLTLRRLRVVDSVVTQPEPGEDEPRGGAIRADGAVRAWHCEFRNCSAGTYTNTNGMVFWEWWTVTRGLGGAIFAVAHVAVGFTNFTGCRADDGGGAVHVYMGDVAIRPGSGFFGNAGTAGGAVHHSSYGALDAGDADDERCATGPPLRFVGNAAVAEDDDEDDILSGGAIHSSGCSVKLANVRAARNAANDGGFLFSSLLKRLRVLGLDPTTFLAAGTACDRPGWDYLFRLELFTALPVALLASLFAIYQLLKRRHGSALLEVVALVALVTVHVLYTTVSNMVLGTREPASRGSRDVSLGKRPSSSL